MYSHDDAQRWPEVSAVVIKAQELANLPAFVHCRLSVLCEYEWEGKKFQRELFVPGSQPDHYPAGQQIKIKVNPEEPEICAMEVL